MENLEDEVKQKRSVIASLGSEMDLSAIRLIRKEERKAEKPPSTPLLLIVQEGSVDPRWSDSVSPEDALALSFFSDSPPCWQHWLLPPHPLVFVSHLRRGRKHQGVCETSGHEKG